MTDIVQELREHHAAIGFDDKTETWLTVAADEIERLREALYECARNLEEQVSASYWHIEQPFDANIQRRYDRDMARARKAFAALGEGKE